MNVTPFTSAIWFPPNRPLKQLFPKSPVTPSQICQPTPGIILQGHYSTVFDPGDNLLSSWHFLLQWPGTFLCLPEPACCSAHFLLSKQGIISLLWSPEITFCTSLWWAIILLHPDCQAVSSWEEQGSHLAPLCISGGNQYGPHTQFTNIWWTVNESNWVKLIKWSHDFCYKVLMKMENVTFPRGSVV